MRKNSLNSCNSKNLISSEEFIKVTDNIFNIKRKQITYKTVILFLFLLSVSNLNAQTLGALATKLNINFEPLPLNLVSKKELNGLETL